MDFSSTDITYPVVADPAWYYVATYPLNNGLLAALGVKNKLKDCFNCYFPVEGAPAAYPVPGQFLPLVVRLADFLPSNNFNCIVEKDTYYTEHDFSPSIPSGSPQDTGNYYFNFTTAPGHVHGPGSRIQFWFTTTQWNPYPGFPFANYQLIVTANITNDFGLVGNDAYTFGATETWAKFAANLVRSTY